MEKVDIQTSYMDGPIHICKLSSPEVQDARRFDGAVQGSVVDGGGAQGLFVAGIDLDGGLQVDTFTAMGDNLVSRVLFSPFGISSNHRSPADIQAPRRINLASETKNDIMTAQCIRVCCARASF